MKKLFMILPLVLALCFVYGCQQGEEGITEEGEKIDLNLVADNIVKAYTSWNPVAMANLYAEDAIIIQVGQNEPVRGRKAIEENFAAAPIAMPDFSVEFTLILISGNHIVFEGFSQGTFTGPWSSPEGDIPPTGKNMKNKFVFIAKVNADGLIEEDRTYFDNLGFMQQLGLIEY